MYWDHSSMMLEINIMISSGCDQLAVVHSTHMCMHTRMHCAIQGSFLIPWASSWASGKFLLHSRQIN